MGTLLGVQVVLTVTFGLAIASDPTVCMVDKVFPGEV